jgi:hypothetical protein
LREFSLLSKDCPPPCSPSPHNTSTPCFASCIDDDRAFSLATPTPKETNSPSPITHVLARPPPPSLSSLSSVRGLLLPTLAPGHRLSGPRGPRGHISGPTPCSPWPPLFLSHASHSKRLGPRRTEKKATEQKEPKDKSPPPFPPSPPSPPSVLRTTPTHSDTHTRGRDRAANTERKRGRPLSCSPLPPRAAPPPPPPPPPLGPPLRSL